MTGKGERVEVRGTRGVMVGLRITLLIGAFVLVAARSFAQTPDEAPELRPIRAELPPTFWERHAGTVILYSVEGVAFVGLIAWLFLKPKPRAVVPIEIQTREELEALRKQSEDGTTLSNVSRCLRRYFAVAFDLPPGELTTAEFSRALMTNEKINSSLADRVIAFLQQCDVAKFSPAQWMSAGSSIAEALEIVTQSEARREELRQTAVAKPIE